MGTLVLVVLLISHKKAGNALLLEMIPSFPTSPPLLENSSRCSFGWEHVALGVSQLFAVKILFSGSFEKVNLIKSHQQPGTFLWYAFAYFWCKEWTFKSNKLGGVLCFGFFFFLMEGLIGICKFTHFRQIGHFQNWWICSCQLPRVCIYITFNVWWFGWSALQHFRIWFNLNYFDAIKSFFLH